jgi:ABC-type lipoprotein export system ATPase subunit
LQRLWNFLLSDAQDRLERASQNLATHLQQLRSLAFDLLDDQAVSYRHLQDQDPQTLQRARQFIEASQRRQENLALSIQQHQISEISPLPENGIRELDQIIGRLLAQRDELVHREVEMEIQHLIQEKLELEHRKLLAEVLDDVVQFIENSRWIETATSGRVKRSTAHISKKYNELFDRLVTQEYIRLFQDTLKKLNCPLLIRIATRAQKGTTIKQIVLQTDASISPDQAPPEKVLSEGEQRAVALADFFTEVRLDKQSCGVVLDDPVTSLDFEWKETIASYIIEEAIRQQVIVFTHDLHFLYLLKDKAEKANVPIQAHWVERREEKPGWIFTNNSPLSEKEYKTTKIPRAIHASAKDPKLPSEEQQRLLRAGFGAMRTCYEAFVMFDLFNGVVLRFEERTRIDQLSKVVIDPDIRDRAVTKMALMSRYIDGHLHSDHFAAQKPTPEMLLQEIVDFEELKQRHKDFKKSQGIKD